MCVCNISIVTKLIDFYILFDDSLNDEESAASPTFLRT